MLKPRSRPRKTSTIATLRARLQAAEDTLDAIRRGAVDAVVVGGPRGDQVFTLTGAETPYRVLVEAMNEGAATLALDGVILYANVRLAELLSLPLPQVIGRALSSFLPAEDAARFDRLLERASQGSNRLETCVRTGAGGSVPVQLSIRPLHLNELRAFSTVITDLSAQRAAQETLQKQARLLDLAHDAIFVRDMDNCITYWNPAAQRCYGWSSAEAVGQCVHRLLDTIFPEPLEDINVRLLKTDYWQGELTHTTRDGSKVTVDSRWSLERDDRGTPASILEINHDITRRLAAERELRRLNEQLEQRVRDRTADLTAALDELEAFSYTVSHDLRAPLRHVEGFAQLLLKHSAAQLDETSRHYVDVITEGTIQMSRLIDDLLAFARTSRTALQLQRVDLGALFSEVQRELSPPAPSAHVSWTVAALPPVVGDPAMLRIVCVNLLSNALKFSARKPNPHIEIGSLPLTECRVPLPSEPQTVPHEHAGESPATVYFVRDNGAGFDMHYAHKLFRVFQRLHRQEEFEGTGIGLATVKRIVERHGGRVWAEGAVDKGATFYFTLPSDPTDQPLLTKETPTLGSDSAPRRTASPGDVEASK